MPDEKWAFDAKVTECFEDMLARSIPQYDVMRDTVHQVARQFVRDGSFIVDLGCSKGGALAAFVDEFGSRCRYTGVDVSEPMLAAAARRFADQQELVEIRKMDLREDYPSVAASVTLAVLTLQFVPINYRTRILRSAYENTLPGGAFIMVEKVLGSDAVTDELMVGRYHAKKADNGYTAEEIDRKRMALEGVLVPVTARWNEEMLKGAGFRSVECVWRWMNFAAWVAVK